MAIRPTPNMPDKEKSPFALIDSAVKPATPDLILFNDAEIPIEIVTELLFEDIGSIEILNIARSDTINGREISYNLIGNLSDLSRRYAPTNIFKLSGTLGEFFNNFAIKFKVHAPDTGTGPDPFYIGDENSFGCTGFPVLDRVTDTVLACLTTFAEAREFVNSQEFKRDIVYSDQENGNIIVDVINLKKDDRVEVELLTEGFLEDDTIY
jgi:hypothetical protein